jgi:hypothetical protein
MSYALREPIQYPTSSIGALRWTSAGQLLRQSDAAHEFGEARIGMEAVQMSGRLRLNYKKASQADCDQVFGYGDENVFCV